MAHRDAVLVNGNARIMPRGAPSGWMTPDRFLEFPLFAPLRVLTAAFFVDASLGMLVESHCCSAKPPGQRSRRGTLDRIGFRQRGGMGLAGAAENFLDDEGRSAARRFQGAQQVLSQDASH